MGQRAGVDNLSNLTGQPKDMIIELEKLLVLKGLIMYTAKGRELTVEGMQKIRLLREGKD
jgi:Holliday junction resolvasome RuvABC ATP-dependent DNA helicase subunit